MNKENQIVTDPEICIEAWAEHFAELLQGNYEVTQETPHTWRAHKVCW